MPSYIALMRKETDSDYGVDFPDFPGCVTAGRTLDEARRMAAEALSLHLEGLVADREILPQPSSLDSIMANPGQHEAMAFLVDAEPKLARAMRINVSLPADLVEEIDRRTSNRSKFLADAARSKLLDAG